MKRRLGELLLDRGHIDVATLEKSIDEQSGRASRLGEMLLDRHWVDKGPLVAALCEITCVPYLDATLVTPHPEALQRIPREAALQFWALPVRFERHALVTILADPLDVHVVNTLQFLCGQRISPRLGFRQEIEKAIASNYPLAQPEEAGAGEEQKRCLGCRGLLEAHFQFCPHCGVSLRAERTAGARRRGRISA